MLNHLLVLIYALFALNRNCVQSALCVDLSASFILYYVKFRQKAGQVDSCADILGLNKMIAYFYSRETLFSLSAPATRLNLHILSINVSTLV